MKPTKCTAREKKNEARKAKVKTVVSLLNPKNLEILLSAHARTSQAVILHLDQKAVKCKTCNWLFSKFLLLTAPQ